MMINSLKFAENIKWRKDWESRFGLEVALTELQILMETGHWNDPPVNPTPAFQV